MIDLKNLEGALKTGAVVKDLGKTVEVITPVFQASFTKNLNELYRGEDGQGTPRYTCGMIFNASNPEAEGYVDMSAVMVPAMERVAAAHNISLKAKGVDPFETGKRFNKQGKEIAGYEDWSMWGTMSKYPKDINRQVQCFNAMAQPCEPSAIYGGCYAIARIQFYKPKKFTTIAMGLGYVQFVADGESFGGTDIEYDAPAAIPGADAVTTPGGFDSF